VSGTAGQDTGLLAPVWAGTGAAALVSDEAWLQAMLDVEVALARAQARLGVIPRAAVGPIEAAARAGRFDLAGIAMAAREAANPVVALVQALTAAVAATDPGAAEYVHRGGTSQDILDSAAMVLSAQVLARIEADLRRVATGLATLAGEHRSTPMAGRTLTQHAVPITFGLKAAGWLNLVLDALRRVRQVAAELPAQLGGAAGTLAAYYEYAKLAGPGLAGNGIELIALFAEELGLAEPALPWHALRTPFADLGSVLTFVAGALGKFAADVQVMTRTEIAELAESGAEAHGTSSAMPQKRNPVLATLVVSAARQVPAYALVLAQGMTGEDERSAGAWHAEWQPLRECLRLVGGAAESAALLAGGLTVFPGRMRANLGLTGGTINAERVNVALAPLLGKAAAKKLLARISAESASGSGTFHELLTAAPELAGRLSGEPSLPDLLDPGRYLGAATELVDRVLWRYRAELTGAGVGADLRSGGPAVFSDGEPDHR
jgi:3-carboxy-cis,cis-muconate cycloisomerase